MASKKIQLYTDRANTIEASPETSANCVILSDGNDLQKVLDNDLTNPTVVHEETSFKVGVGDIDVSSSVVDGEVGRMVIKGKTYQNILPEPSTHVLTNNKEMFKVNEGLDPNVEIVDAVSKSAILSGRTLVNLQQKGINWNINGNGGNASYSSEEGFPLSKLKPSTKYLIKFNKDISSFVNSIFFAQGVNTVNNINGDYAIVTTLDVLTTSKIGIHVYPKNNTLLTKELLMDVDVMIIEYKEGMENWDIPYFEGMQSVKLPVLTTTGKNLFDGKIEIGSIDNRGEVYVNVNHKRCVNFIPVKGNTTYTISKEKASDGYLLVHQYDENKNFIKYNAVGVYQKGIFTTDSNTRFVKFRYEKVDDNNFQIEEGSVATTYEPFKSNILTVNEDVELGSVGEIKDELNLLTGEITSYSYNYTITGDEPWTDWANDLGEYVTFYFYYKNSNMPNIPNEKVGKGICNKFKVVGNVYNSQQRAIGIGAEYLSLGIKFSELNITSDSTRSERVNALKTWLKNNNVEIRLPYAQEVVKTVDLLSSGNWEKIVLDGSETWENSDSSMPLTHRFVCYGNTNDRQHGVENIICDNMQVKNVYNSDEEGILGSQGGTQLYLRVLKSKLPTTDVNGLKQYLQQNPITVWYRTANHKDSTQVKQPIFFKDGHIQLSSGVDNSLIPTLDYQAKTSNSYVMDLMKTNTKYTMKAKTTSGTFTIDGTSYNAGTNGTFTTPSSMTNKLLIMSNTTNEEVMVIEGDVTDKTIPYFKGIKSAFEDESKIEVLSSNCANLFHPKDIVNEHYWELDVTGKAKIFLSAPRRGAVNMVQRDSNGIELMARVNEVEDQIEILPNAKTLRLVGGCFRPTDAWYELITQNLIVADAKSENNTKEIDYKSNSTKIPLLSPLRSLPNGVCDELVVDRMKKKATLIQRVGYGMLGRQRYGYNQANSSVNTNLYQPWHTKDLGNNVANVPSNKITMWCDKLLVENTSYHSKTTNSIHQYQDGSANFVGCLLKSNLGTKTVQQWFEANEVSVYYELATPVVTEIDLESFPLVYKDGHIFLNSEIAPVVEIDYSINQSQQIQSNNETLQRHELDILDLDNLIVSFVNAEYNLRLLKFDMELSMMALAE